MTIMRTTLRWTGFEGSPGYTNLYFGAGGGLISDAPQVLDRIRDALLPLVPVFPDGVNISVDGEVAYIDEDTGEVESFEDTGTTGGVVSNTSGPYSAASGAVINWRTDDVRFGRRIRGRTFLVPLAGSSYQDDGSLSADARGLIQDFAAAISAWDFDSHLMVWSRPRDGSGGVAASVTGFQVPDMAAVLRSRRD